MSNRRNTATLSLEDLCKEKLKIHINEAIERVDLKVEPGICIVVTDKKLDLMISVHLPIKKAIAMVGGAITIAFTLIKVLMWASPLFISIIKGIPTP
jgi:hypothetical protein